MENSPANIPAGTGKACQLNIMLKSLTIYRNLLEDPVIKAFCQLTDLTAKYASAGSPGTAALSSGRLASLYGSFFNQLAARSPLLDFKEYVAEKVLLDENPFTTACSAGTPSGAETLLKAVRWDLEALSVAVLFPPRLFKEITGCTSENTGVAGGFFSRLPEWSVHTALAESTASPRLQHCYQDFSQMKKLLFEYADWDKLSDELCNFHSINGCGKYIKYRAFSWQRPYSATPREEGSDGELVPIDAPDPVRLSDLIAYESEREEVVRNTRQFINGMPANNVLLYGDRGTGKSSTVKAILNEYYAEGLRMVEVKKQHLADFPQIIRELSGRRQKFIVFIDDLAFGDDEENYTALKAVLEGSLEIKPENVLIYATSNRRHLIKEKFSDRAGLAYGTAEVEIRAADSMQEKLSLSDRFGITVVFPAPDKNRYLKIVDNLAAMEGIGLDTETLHREALKWELWYNGRSPRSARQFISWIKGSSPD